MPKTSTLAGADLDQRKGHEIAVAITAGFIDLLLHIWEVVLQDSAKSMEAGNDILMLTTDSLAQVDTIEGLE